MPLQLEIGIEGLFGVKWASGQFALYAIEPSGQLLCTFVPKWVKKAGCASAISTFEIGWKAQGLVIGFNNSMVNRNLKKSCTTTIVCENNISMSDGGQCQSKHPAVTLAYKVLRSHKKTLIISLNRFN